MQCTGGIAAGDTIIEKTYCKGDNIYGNQDGSIVYKLSICKADGGRESVGDREID